MERGAEEGRLNILLVRTEPPRLRSDSAISSFVTVV